MIRQGTTDWLRDPQAIYAKSFATIAAEADLSGIDPGVRAVAIRMIHACGMVDLATDVRISPDLMAKTKAALVGGAPILVDCEMVRHGIIARALPLRCEILCTLNNPETPERALALATTRSAAAVEAWLPHLAGAVVVIGNAPTALFALLEAMEAGAPAPAALIACPVGFVGAAESKALLASVPRTFAFATVLGRRGGSAIAAAALNACFAP